MIGWIVCMSFHGPTALSPPCNYLACQRSALVPPQRLDTQEDACAYSL